MYQPTAYRVFPMNYSLIPDCPIDELIQFTTPYRQASVSLINVISSLFLLQECNNLRIKNGVKYDYIIRARTEIVYTNLISSEFFNMAKSAIVIPKGFDNLGYNDLFAICNPEHIDIYVNQIDYIKQYIDSGLLDFFHPEYFLKKHLDYFNISVIRPAYNLKLRNRQPC